MKDQNPLLLSLSLGGIEGAFYLILAEEVCCLTSHSTLSYSFNEADGVDSHLLEINFHLFLLMNAVLAYEEVLLIPSLTYYLACYFVHA